MGEFMQDVCVTHPRVLVTKRDGIITFRDAGAGQGQTRGKHSSLVTILNCSTTQLGGQRVGTQLGEVRATLGPPWGHPCLESELRTQVSQPQPLPMALQGDQSPAPLQGASPAPLTPASQLRLRSASARCDRERFLDGWFPQCSEAERGQPPRQGCGGGYEPPSTPYLARRSHRLRMSGDTHSVAMHFRSCKHLFHNPRTTQSFRGGFLLDEESASSPFQAPPKPLRRGLSVIAVVGLCVELHSHRLPVLVVDLVDAVQDVNRRVAHAFFRVEEALKGALEFFEIQRIDRSGFHPSTVSGEQVCA